MSECKVNYNVKKNYNAKLKITHYYPPESDKDYGSFVGELTLDGKPCTWSEKNAISAIFEGSNQNDTIKIHFVISESKGWEFCCKPFKVTKNKKAIYWDDTVNPTTRVTLYLKNQDAKHKNHEITLFCLKDGKTYQWDPKISISRSGV